MPQNPNFKTEEIDLGELLAGLWSHKMLIIFFTGLATFLAGNYAITTEKKFTASAIFQIEEQNKSSGFNISGELGALASIAGLSGVGKVSSSEILLERVAGREFIISMKEIFSLDLDPFFNTYDPQHKDPFWKATIKKIIGWQKTEQDKNSIVENNVIKNYRENVVFLITKVARYTSVTQQTGKHLSMPMGSCRK